MSSKNNGFTASDIERYHSGNMLPEERHTLEKAALDDPFLADALEGYAFTSAPLDELKKIQTRLEEKINRKKVTPFFQKYKWLSAAAIFLIIAGTGWLAYTISKHEDKSSFALKKEKTPENSSNYKMPEQTTVPDSNHSNTTTSLNTHQNKSEKSQTHIYPKKSTENISSDNQKQLEELTVDIPEQTSKKKQELYFKERTLTPTENNVVSMQDKIVPTKNGFIDTLGKFAKRNNAVSFRPLSNNTTAIAGKVRGLNPPFDSTSNHSSAIRIRGTVTNDTIKNLTIVLQSLPMDSAQTVVLAQDAKRKTTDKYPRVIIDTLEPAEGYVSFDDYVANNLRMPEEIRDKPSGEVQLSFDVDKDGQATNITVVKSLCQKCDEEAIRLLKEGPKWKKKKNKKGKITFKF